MEVEERLDGFCYDVDLNLLHWILNSSPRSQASPLKCGGKEEQTGSGTTQEEFWGERVVGIVVACDGEGE